MSTAETGVRSEIPTTPNMGVADIIMAGICPSCRTLQGCYLDESERRLVCLHDDALGNECFGSGFPRHITSDETNPAE